MVRLVGIALLGLSLAPAAWSKPPGGSAPAAAEATRTEASQLPSRSFIVSGNSYSDLDDGRLSLQTEIAPNARLGLGIFGLKSDKSHLRPVTARELGMPRQRRAGVGFSLRF